MADKAMVEALAKARSEMPALVFDATNPHFKNHYASLAAHLDCVLPALAANGFALTQTTRTDGTVCVLITTLRHVQGGVVTSEYPVIPARPGPQEMGSALSYARRYSISAMFALAAGDDDGNDASEKARPTSAGGAATRAAPSANPAKATPAAGTTRGPATSDTKATATGKKAVDPLHAALHASLKDAGLTKRESGLLFLSEVLGREVVSTAMMTDDEKRKAIDELKRAKIPTAREPGSDDQ